MLLFSIIVLYRLYEHKIATNIFRYFLSQNLGLSWHQIHPRNLRVHPTLLPPPLLTTKVNKLFQITIKNNHLIFIAKLVLIQTMSLSVIPKKHVGSETPNLVCSV